MTAEPRQQSPEWYDARRHAIGSSDLPIITGSSPYRGSSPVTLWAIKTKTIEPEPPDPATQEMFDLGHALEPVIAARYTILTGRPLKRATRLIRHPELPWAVASLDRVSAVKGERIIVELKWLPNRSWGDGPELVPAHVQDQVQWQMFVTGWPMAHVAALSGSRVSWFEVPGDADYQAGLLALASAFRDAVVTKTRPVIDGSESTRRTLARMYPRETLDLLDPTPEVDALAMALRDAKAAAKAATEEEDRLANVLRAVLGDHEGVEGDWGRVTWTQNKATTKTDWKAAYADLAAAVLDDGWSDEDQIERRLAKHTTTTEGARVLRSRFAGEEK